MKSTITALALVPLLSSMAAFGIYGLATNEYDSWFSWSIVFLAITGCTAFIAGFVDTTEKRLDDLEKQVRDLPKK